jgi:hypothetical protein
MKIFSMRTVTQNLTITFFTVMPNPSFTGMRDLLFHTRSTTDSSTAAPCSE